MTRWTLSRRCDTELLGDHVACLLKGDDPRGKHAHLLETLVDRGLADAEVTGGVGLRPARFEKPLKIRRIEFRSRHGRKLKES